MTTLQPKRTREAVLQCLFSFEMGGEAEAMVALLKKEMLVSQKFALGAFTLAMAIWAQKEDLDNKIKNVTLSYDWSRVSLVEKSVLRLSAYELLIEKKLAVEIIIDEALRLTTKFSTPEGAHFVHAILDTLHKNPLSPSVENPSSSLLHV